MRLRLGELVDAVEKLCREKPELFYLISYVLMDEEIAKNLRKSFKHPFTRGFAARLRSIGIKDAKRRGEVEELKDESVQRVIEEEELEKYLRKGWRFIATLNNGKVVVEKQNNLI